MQTIKEHFSKSIDLNIIFRIFYDEWEAPESTKRVQRCIDNVLLENAIDEYGNWIYRSGYTTAIEKDFITIDIWADATDERRYSSEYNNQIIKDTEGDLDYE